MKCCCTFRTMSAYRRYRSPFRGPSPTIRKLPSICWSAENWHSSELPLGHRIEEVLVRLGAPHAVEQEFQRFGGRHVGQEVTQQVNAIELGLVQQQIFLTRTGAIDVDRREHALV